MTSSSEDAFPGCPRLSSIMSSQWLATNKGDPILAWHPLTTDQAAGTASQLELALAVLDEHEVVGWKDRAEKLRSLAREDYLAGCDELRCAAVLAQHGYQVEFVPEDPVAKTPDIVVDLGSDLVCIEVTSANRTWTHDSLPAFLEQSLGGANHSSRIHCRADTDMFQTTDDELSQLASEISGYLSGGPYSLGELRTFQIAATGGIVEVDVIEQGWPSYTYATDYGGADGFATPMTKFVWRVVARARQKSQQLASCSHGIVVMNMSRESDLALLWALPLPVDNLWPALLQEFDRPASSIPDKVDAVVLTWSNSPDRIRKNTSWCNEEGPANLLQVLQSI
jgi:hypothetical protein